MENKKTLWIVAATGAFLLVVLGAALIMSSSNNKTSYYSQVSPVEKTQPKNNSGWDNPPSDYMSVPLPGQSGPEVHGPDTIKTDELNVYSENTNIYDLSAASAAAPDGTTIDLTAKPKAVDANQTQNINVTVTFADQDKVPVFAPRPQPPVPQNVKPAEPAKTTSVTKKAAKKPAAASAAPTVKAAPKTPVIVKYWVQVAAYSNKKGAENARAALSSNRIESDIFTYKDNKDRLFYRVRVGPYTTKSEAEYWRQKIAAISEFTKAQSYVTSTEQ